MNQFLMSLFLFILANSRKHTKSICQQQTYFPSINQKPPPYTLRNLKKKTVAFMASVEGGNRMLENYTENALILSRKYKVNNLSRNAKNCFKNKNANISKSRNIFLFFCSCFVLGIFYIYF